MVLDERTEVSIGAEGAYQRSPRTLVRDAGLRLENTTGPQQSLDELDHDRSQGLYVALRRTMGPARIDLGLAWSDYRKDRDIDTFTPQQTHFSELYERRKLDPAAGIVWTFAPQWRARAACRRWTRPISPDTLAPIA